MQNSEIIAEIEGTNKPRKRLFEAGEMKLLVLYFISQNPKYSYDIIKDVSALVGGNYKPSTGTICPTINYLEEQQYSEVHFVEDERKQYHITQKGIMHLQEQQQILDKVLNRFNTRNQIQSNVDYLAIKIAMENLKAALRQNIQNEQLSSESIAEIAQKIDQAAVEIMQLAQQKVNK